MYYGVFIGGIMKIFIAGITGAMGSALLSIIEKEEVVAGYANENTVINGINVYNDLNNVTEDFDVIIDFSNKDCTDEILDFAKNRKSALVEATTGLVPELVEKIEQYSIFIPIVHSNNMSLGINTMDTVVEYLVEMLKDFDIEIIEKHHNKKVDAPSGTAKMLFDSIKRKRDVVLSGDRTKRYSKREKNEVGISIVRAGSIVGEHSVIFAGIDEVVEIKHIASSKKIFATGAINAAYFLSNKNNGLYTMKDVLKSNN